MSEMTAPPTSSEVSTYRYLCNGKWLEAVSTFSDYEPYTGEVFAEVPDCGRPEAKAAVEAAAAAFEEWSLSTPSTRAQVFLKAAEIVERRRSEIAGILARETGSSARFAQYQQTIVIKMLEKCVDWVYQPVGEIMATDYPGTRVFAERRPLGVVASFTPWNGASVLGWRGLITPLAWGCTVVSKPSEMAPISAGLVMAEILDEAGLTKGAVNCLTHAPGAAGPIADEFFENAEVRVINFVGSVGTGRILAERAGRALKRSVMELGGYNPLVICDDVDLGYAARVATFSSFFHQGQICTNARKIYVERPIYDEFVERFVARTEELPIGDPTAEGTIIGPLITPQAVAKVTERVEDAVARGGRVATGGRAEGQVYAPTILLDVPDDAAVSCDETFGPVVIVEPVDSAEEAIEDANKSLYGLAASILSKDLARAERMGAKIKSGLVHINVPTVHEELHHPGGGVRDSGWGRIGPHSVHDFTDVVRVVIEPGERVLPID
jgi:acyl-CoA reductase-like NAD-dependent aldehyde dehydrogenase